MFNQIVSLNTATVFRGLALACGLLGLAACQSTLPASGPLENELKKQSETQSFDEFGYQLVEINEETMATVLRHQPKAFGEQFSGKHWKPTSKVGVGDVLSVVVWESSPDGLFAGGKQGKRAELGPFQVEQSGKIPVPYIGQVTVKGRTIAQIRWAIQSGLEGKAIDPQVVVSLKHNESSSVAVIGAVRQPGQIPISQRGARILDMLARAGGSATPAAETMLTFIRDGKRGTLLLRDVYENAADNIYVRPGDQIIISHDPQTFTAFGAVQRVGEYPIKARDVSLIEAVGRIGGLSDQRANSKGLYIFRYENANLLRELQVLDTSDIRERIPVIYKLNMREGRSYFFAQAFPIRDKDILYVANSYGAEFQKFANIIASATGPVTGAAVTINNLSD